MIALLTPVKMADFVLTSSMDIPVTVTPRQDTMGLTALWVSTRVIVIVSLLSNHNI